MVSRFFAKLEEGLIIFLLAAMTLITFAHVVLRYVFQSDLIWAIEATSYLFAWLVLIGISYGVRVGSHIGVDAAVKLLPARGRQIAGVIGGLLSMLYAAILLVGSWNYFETVRQIGVMAEDIPVQRWIFVIILPLGFALLLLRLVQMTWSILRGEEVGFRIANEVADALKQRSSLEPPNR